jgi:hypothetical protein
LSKSQPAAKSEMVVVSEKKRVKNDPLESALFWLPWVKSGKFWAGVLVAIGIAGEIIGDRLAAPFEKTIEDARESQIELLKKETADAKLETAKLEKEIAFRSLNPDRAAEIESKLKPFGPQRVAVLAYDGVPDAVPLLIQVRDLLKASGWTPLEGSITEKNRFMFGLMVETTPKADSQARAAAKELCDALRAEKLVLVEGPQERRVDLVFHGVGVADAPIYLTIGFKPPYGGKLR